jgi:small subunit ribosomal protein S18
MAEKRKFSKKYCKYSAMKVEYVDYKNLELLKISLSERGKIMPRRLTGTSKKTPRAS